MSSTNYIDFIYPSPQSYAAKAGKTILEAMYQGSNLYAIRIAIADLIDNQLKRGNDANNEEALPYFINALGSLTLHVTTKNGDVPIGLYPCLFDLEIAIAILDGEESGKSRQYVKRAEQLNYKFLLDTLNAIRQSPAFQPRSRQS